MTRFRRFGLEGHFESDDGAEALDMDALKPHGGDF